MNEIPQVEPLKHAHRVRFFWLMFVVFLCTLPTVVFYAAGYRFHFDGDDQTPNIVTTGGMYISVPDDAADIYLDEVLVDNARIFRNASYIQSLNAGMHRVHVQREGAYTWVKQLPVESQIVIEAAAFTMPEVSQLRPITRYVTATGSSVYFSATTNINTFDGVTSTEPYVVSTRASVAGYEENEEFEFIESLFAATSTDTSTLLDRWQVDQERFTFATSTTRQPATTTPLIENDITLVEQAGELYARFIGESRNTPYYFCIVNYTASTTAALYGTHVADAFALYDQSTTTPLVREDIRTCRPEIRIDRSWQDVLYYTFFPNSSDLILLQLEDGLYVTEIDDRAWQNSQRVFTGNDFTTLVENEVVYIERNGLYFELVLEIEES